MVVAGNEGFKHDRLMSTSSNSDKVKLARSASVERSLNFTYKWTHGV